eukprot:1126924-Prorocentrum_minimum.AAC.1
MSHNITPVKGSEGGDSGGRHTPNNSLSNIECLCETGNSGKRQVFLATTGVECTLAVIGTGGP